jgi:hypothetical protein
LLVSCMECWKEFHLRNMVVAKPHLALNLTAICLLQWCKAAYIQRLKDV